jgi:hypothetical protein
MEHHRMPQDVLLAEHHGTFHDTPSNKMHQLVALPSKQVGYKREGTKKMESLICV